MSALPTSPERENEMKIRKLSLALFFLLCVNLGYAKLEIIVKSSPDWGPISDADVEYLCQNIVDHFEKELRPENEINEGVNVYRTTVGYSFLNLDLKDPEVKYKMGVQMSEDMNFLMRHFWDFIIRFGHEFTHILQIEQKGIAYRETFNANLWFQEAIAEMGCIWGLKSMADTWKHGSKFGTGLQTDRGFSEFSTNFDFYADWYMGLHPYNGTVEEWLEKNEDSLREQYHRSGKINMDIVRQVYPKFLPIFEENPQAWNAVRKMPVTNTEKMSKYMQDWHDAVDAQDKQYVEAIATEMGITVTSPVIASTEIDADVNNDGYIDLYDVMIVRSGMQNSVSYDTDVNNDGITDEVDLLIVKAKAMEAIAAAAPRAPHKRKMKLTTWGSIKRK